MADPNQPAVATSSSYAAALSSNITVQDPYHDLMAQFKSSVTVTQQTNPRTTRPRLPMGYTEYYFYTDQDTRNPTDPRMRQTIGYTENKSYTYLNTGNPCLDFFFHEVPTIWRKELTEYLESAWAKDPEMTLKLICNLRGVRGTGKSDKEGFYKAALWLHHNHPRTLACNLGSIAEFGYFKDFPEILLMLLEGPRKDKREWPMKYVRRAILFQFERRASLFTRVKNIRRLMRRTRKENTTPNLVASREERVLAAEQKNQEEAAAARKLRHEKKLSAAKKVLDRLSSDPHFQFLHDCIATLFSDYLKSDIQNLNSGNIRQISLAAKWCPSLKSFYDRTTLLCEAIARKIFPKESDPEYELIEDAHYAYRVRDRLRKEILVPLRKALELPEVYIGENRWGSIPYNRVSSMAMNFYKEKFLKHDKERFEEYLGKVETGEAEMAERALLPHKIIAALEHKDGGRVAEVQWKRMVDDMARKGKLRNCLAICNSRMRRTPLELSIALGVLVSELSEKPWKGRVFTFSRNPTLHIINSKKLKNKVNFMRRMDSGRKMDFQKVFDVILKVAKKAKLIPDQMIKKVFVFSDTEFHSASSRPWETDYRMLKRKFIESGYREAVPEIVFWNLRAYTATYVPADQSGLTLVSGYSKNLLKLFLNEGGVIDPEIVMKAAIAGEEYQGLVVFD